ncbi:DUF4382 domain-containing protein [Candidatus Fermentibacteria bacterium]|nr:DUF4382 domain-containing protein [Candidatus Fermentibacteria bacterium]
MLRRTLMMALIAILTVGCGEESPGSKGEELVQPSPPQTGTLHFVANGEGFAVEPFESKDGWTIDLDHVYISFDEVTGYLTDPPFDPHGSEEMRYTSREVLAGSCIVDLADGPVRVGSVDDAQAGHYNATSWLNVPSDGGPSEGFSVLLVGTATKADALIEFSLGVAQSYRYLGGEYVGGERKGLLRPGEEAELEMTFHLDHIFGTAELPPQDQLNADAIGFQAFADIAEEGRLETTLAELEGKLPEDEFGLLSEALRTLGHVGEGHCRCTVM